jgi:hypothetical protein
VPIKASHCLFTKEIYTVWQNLSKSNNRKNLIRIFWETGSRRGIGKNLEWEKIKERGFEK